jgi:lipopolysaccharide transport system ATP-binding protein
MYVRLAFSVAAHLDPEILVVDEVLAVGDAEFQKKCLAKMDGAASYNDRTVLFVSHNMVAVRQLCKRGIWLDGGRVRHLGPIDEVADAYMASGTSSQQSGELSSLEVKGDGSMQLLSYRVTDGDGREDVPLTTHGDILIHVTLKSESQIAHPVFGMVINNHAGVRMTNLNTREQGAVMPAVPEGESVVSIRIRNVQFLPGRYTVNFHVINTAGHTFASTESIEFEIAQSAIYGTCQVDSRWGCVFVDAEFSLGSPAVESEAGV